MSIIKELVEAKREYDKIAPALAAAKETGYGVVAPSMDDMVLEEPEMVRQGGRYGVKLKASAPSLHLIRADVKTEVSPVVGSEQQGEEMVRGCWKALKAIPRRYGRAIFSAKACMSWYRRGCPESW